MFSINDALQDPAVLQELEKSPWSFQFKEAPTAVVTMVPFPPHVIVDKNGYDPQLVKAAIPTTIPFRGPMFELIELIGRSINFTHKEVMPPDGFWGSLTDNGSWSGMMGQVFRKEADFGMGPFSSTRSRYTAVDMPINFFYDALSMLVARGKATIDPWAFLQPLTATVWVVFLAVFMGTCLVHFAFESFYHPKSQYLKLFGAAVFEYIQPPMDHALDRTVWRAWQRPLIGAWILVSLLMNSSYSGNLRSLMALQHIPHPIQTLRDLVDDTSRNIILEPGGSYIQAIRKVPIGDIKDFSDAGDGGRYIFDRMKNFLSYKHLVLEGNVQILPTWMSLFYRAQLFSMTGRCDFYKAKETFIPIMASIICQKNSPLTPAVTSRISSIIESGLYDHWLTSGVENATACASPPMKVALSEPISFQNIWGLGVVWVVGLSLAAAAFVLELISTKR